MRFELDRRRPLREDQPQVMAELEEVKAELDRGIPGVGWSITTNG
jgi:hypothetical protein